MTVLTEARTALPTGTWTLDPVHSTIGFELPYLAGTFRGHFTDVDAKLTAESLAGSARVASVDVKDENLAAHLQSPDFFDAERFPTLRFVAEDVDLDSKSVVVPGQITIKGVTKPVEVTGTLSEPMADAYGNERLGLKLSARVDRTDFGVDWNMPLPTGDQALANDVTIVAELQLVKAA
jgi:polyisoprenoid-binding protein YceI